MLNIYHIIEYRFIISLNIQNATNKIIKPLKKVNVIGLFPYEYVIEHNTGVNPYIIADKTVKNIPFVLISFSHPKRIYYI